MENSYGGNKSDKGEKSSATNSEGDSSHSETYYETQKKSKIMHKFPSASARSHGEKQSANSGKGQFIEMQIFNDFSNQKKDNSTRHGFSDEEIKHPNSYMQSEDHPAQRKVRSLETERNVNKKYKLDNIKLTKEFSQDFLEEYKGVHNPYNPQRPVKKAKLIKKSYESDTHEGKKGPIRNHSDSNLEDSRTLDKSEDDEDFLFYNQHKPSLTSKLC